MARSLLLVPAIVIAVLLAAAPVAAAPAANPETGPTVSIDFELAANHGLRANVETSEGEVTLAIYRGPYFASYEVHGEITESGLKAQFGKLGLIDVTFSPTKTLSATEPPEVCQGEPQTRREGYFAGTIAFTGERNYVRIETGRAKGVMKVDPEWNCPRRGGTLPLRDAPHLSTSGPQERSEPKEDPAILYAFNRRCRCAFAAFGVRDSKDRGPSFFSASKFENREGMKIARALFARAGASALVFDHEAGTAKVDPPQPLSGNATFERRPHGRDLWRSTIRVPLLGTDPLSVRGPSFRAGLRREFPFEGR